MTCPGCARDDVALIGGYCGMCTAEISGAIGDALEEAGIDADVHDVFKHRDGFVHVRLDEDGGTA